MGQANAEAEVERLQAVRRNVVEDQLKEEQGTGTNAIIVRQRTELDTIPAGGVPAFIAVYKAAVGGGHAALRFWRPAFRRIVFRSALPFGPCTSAACFSSRSRSRGL